MVYPIPTLALPLKGRGNSTPNQTNQTSKTNKTSPTSQTNHE
jgi:hypothetical protein